MNNYMQFKRSTNFRIAIILIALIIIICGILGLVSYYNLSITLSESIKDSLINRAVDNGEFINSQINEFKIVIEGVAAITAIKTMDWDIQKPVLLSEAKRLGIKRFQVMDKDGFTHSTNGVFKRLTGRHYFAKALQGYTTLSEPFKGEIENEIIVICATPIKSEDGRVKGVLSASLNPQFLSDMVKSRKVGKTGYIFILNKAGTVLAHANEELVLSQASVAKDIEKYPEERELAALERKMINGETGFGFYKYHGINKCMSYAPIPGTDWFIALAAPKQELFYEINAIKGQFTGAMLLVILTSVAFIMLALRYVSRRESMEALKRNFEQSSNLLRESAQMDKLRTQFFANISHEFRTPLNVILGALQLMDIYIQDNTDSSEDNRLNKIARHMKALKQNCRRLLRLVNNLIDVTRIDAGFFELHLHNYNIVSIVEEITLSIGEYTNQKGINLVFDTEIEDMVIACDADMIERIVLNILSNAIKFTQTGGSIFVNIYKKGNNVAISVKDTGIGIPADKQAIIFEPFRQVDQSLTRDHEGSGIGLSLVRLLVELHNGKISLQSKYGVGSEFTIELPAVLTANSQNCEETDKLGVNHNISIEKINIEFSDIYMD